MRLYIIETHNQTNYRSLPGASSFRHKIQFSIKKDPILWNFLRVLNLDQIYGKHHGPPSHHPTFAYQKSKEMLR